jgi:hypothetical protein
LSVCHSLPCGNPRIHAFTYIVFWLPIPKLGSEDLDQLAATPSLLAVGVISIMVWGDATETTIQIVRRRPWIARGHEYIGSLFNGVRGGNWIDVHEGHAGKFEFALPKQIGRNARRGSQIGDCETRRGELRLGETKKYKEKLR